MTGILLVGFAAIAVVCSAYARNPYIFTTGLLAFITHVASVLLPSLNVNSKIPRRRQGTPLRLLIVLGSGGHTSEMLSLMKDLDCAKYRHRSYVVSSGDEFSVQRAEAFEGELSKKFTTELYGGFDITVIPRARRVHQPLATTPFTASLCLFSCFRVLRAPTSSQNQERWIGYPNLIISNGPGTGVIVMLAALLLQIFGLADAKSEGIMRTIYVESWARVKRLSLSGRILLHVVDRFVVQWASLLSATGPKGEYIGTLIV